MRYSDLHYYNVPPGSQIITPAAATAIASSTPPWPLVPLYAYAAAGTTNPTVVLGSQTITPAAATAIASTTAPTILNNTLVSPSASTVIVSVSGPTIVQSSATMTPDAAESVASASGPTVVQSGMTVAPAAATAVAGSTAPTVLIQTIVAPAVSSAVASASIGAVVIGVEVAPAAASAILSASMFAAIETPLHATAVAGAENPPEVVTEEPSKDVVLPLLEVEGVALNGGVGEAALSLPALQVGTAWVHSTGLAIDGDIELPRPIVTGEVVSGAVGTGAVTLPLPEASGGDAEAIRGGVTFPSMTASGAGIAGATGSAALVLPSLVVAGLGLGAAGAVGDGDVSGAIILPSLKASGTVAAGFLGSAHLTLPALVANGRGGAEFTNVITGAIELPVLVVEGTGGPLVTGEGAVTLPMLIVEGAGGPDIMADLLNGRFLLRVSCMNTGNAGVTQFQNYSFNSYCNQNGHVLAASPEGIFVLEGEKDEESNIDLKIGKLEMSLGSSMLKRATDAYFRIRAGGDYKLKIIADGSEAELTIDDANMAVHGKKKNLPRGLKGRRLGVNVSNVDGDDMTLEALELMVEILSRRAR